MYLSVLFIYKNIYFILFTDIFFIVKWSWYIYCYSKYQLQGKIERFMFCPPCVGIENQQKRDLWHRFCNLYEIRKNVVFVVRYIEILKRKYEFLVRHIRSVLFNYEKIIKKNQDLRPWTSPNTDFWIESKQKYIFSKSQGMENHDLYLRKQPNTNI